MSNNLKMFIAAATCGSLAVATAPSLAQISYFSADRYVRGTASCGNQEFSSQSFENFNHSPSFLCGSNIGQASQISTLNPGTIHLAHYASAGGSGASGTSTFTVTFDIASTVTYSLTASDGGFGGLPTTGTLTGPGTSINFGLGGVTAANGMLSPGRYTMTSAVSSPIGRPTVLVDLVVQPVPYSIDWFSIDCGGGSTSGGSFALSGTIGQHDASNALSGETFAVTGGFWLDLTPPCLADFNHDGTVDFFDYLDFVAAFSSSDPAADFNQDSVIDFFDYLDFVAAFSAGC